MFSIAVFLSAFLVMQVVLISQIEAIESKGGTLDITTDNGELIGKVRYYIILLQTHRNDWSSNRVGYAFIYN